MTGFHKDSVGQGKDLQKSHNHVSQGCVLGLRILLKSYHRNLGKTTMKANPNKYSVCQLLSTSFLVAIRPVFEPREPTTRILKLIDEVRGFLLSGQYKANTFCFSNGLAFTDVLHLLDQRLSSGI